MHENIFYHNLVQQTVQKNPVDSITAYRANGDNTYYYKLDQCEEICVQTVKKVIYFNSDKHFRIIF